MSSIESGIGSFCTSAAFFLSFAKTVSMKLAVQGVEV